MEELTRLTGLRPRAAVILAVLGLALGAAVAGRADEAELSRALKALGAPGTLWGRLAVEEESPDGPWTPLAGVTVTVYPYTAGLAADLERIRDGARASGRDYDVAIGRLQERLTAHATQVAALTGIPGAPRAPHPGPFRAPPLPGRSGLPPGPASPPAPKTSTPGILSELAGRFGLTEKGAPSRRRDRRRGEGAATAPAAEGLIRRATTDATGLFLFRRPPGRRLARRGRPDVVVLRAPQATVVVDASRAGEEPRRLPRARAAPGQGSRGLGDPSSRDFR